MGRKRVEPNQEFGSPETLLSLSKKTKDPELRQRYLALRALMLGQDRDAVMTQQGISWSVLQKWVRLWNKGGVDAIQIGKPTGRPSRLTPEAKAYVEEIVEFTHPKTGEKVTGRFISGRLKKSIRDMLVRKCDLLSSPPDGVQSDSPPDASR